MESIVKDHGSADVPFKAVVVGVDEHQGGRDAMALAEVLLAVGGSVSFARVDVRDSLLGHSTAAIDPLLSLPGHRGRAGPLDDGEDADQLEHVESSSVGRGLHDLAYMEGADLLVVGSSHRGLLGRVMLKDDTSDALSGTPCAIAIAPFGFAERPAVLGEIGVAYDGSPESEEALEVARALAVGHGSRLSAFQVVSLPSSLSAPCAGTVIESLPLPALIDEARARIAALGEVEPHAAYGVPAEELAIYSASLDLLVLGSCGYGPTGRLGHGSTSRRLARTARCPLLVLTRDTRARLLAELGLAGRAPVTASTT
jgi:nucleotide-binding universal stress UspA family protein